MAKKPGRKGQQEPLPTLGIERNAKVYAAAVAYRKIVRQRVIYTNKETEARETLESCMKEAEITHYGPDGDIEVILAPGKTKVKLIEADAPDAKAPKDKDDDGDDD